MIANILIYSDLNKGNITSDNESGHNFYGLYLLGFMFRGSKNAEAEQILVPDLQIFSAVVLCTENSLK